MPTAQEKIAAAKVNDLWSFLDDVEALIKPDDLIAPLDAEPPAGESFDASAPSSQCGILERIKQAKRPETRAKRIAETARLAARNTKANHPKGR